MRSFKNNILKIKKIKKKIRFFRYRKIENLCEINSKIMMSKLNEDLFLLKLSIKRYFKKLFNYSNYIASNETRNRTFNKKKDKI